MELQDQIYILSGVFAGALLMLFIAVLTLLYRINHVSKDFKNHKNQFKSNYAYTNPQILQNEELGLRGFSQYGGKIESVDQINMLGTSPQPDYNGNQMGNNNNFGWQQAPPSHSNPVFENTSTDFTRILNNDNIVFGGDNDDRERESDRKRSNLKNKGYPHPPQSIMNKMKVKSNPAAQNPNDSKSYYNNRAMNVY